VFALRCNPQVPYPFGCHLHPNSKLTLQPSPVYCPPDYKFVIRELHLNVRIVIRQTINADFGVSSR
jgi:hypothetical protein